MHTLNTSATHWLHYRAAARVVRALHDVLTNATRDGATDNVLTGIKVAIAVAQASADAEHAKWRKEPF